MADGDENTAEVVHLGDWVTTEDEQLSTELNLEAPHGDVLARRTVRTRVTGIVAPAAGEDD